MAAMMAATTSTSIQHAVAVTCYGNDYLDNFHSKFLLNYSNSNYDSVPIRSNSSFKRNGALFNSDSGSAKNASIRSYHELAFRWRNVLTRLVLP